MTNFDPATLDWQVGLLAGWTYDKPVNKWFQGEFRNAHRLTRPCPTCRGVIVLDVTAKALQGNATNHGLALRRCKECRVALKAANVSNDYAQRKALGAERKAAEPVQQQTAVASTEDGEELKRLRDWEEVFFRALKHMQTKLPDTTMLNVDERIAFLIKSADGIFAEHKKQFEEVQVLKAQLAKYDLPAAMVQQAKPAILTLPPEPLTMAQSIVNLNLQAAFIAKNKMPWA